MFNLIIGVTTAISALLAVKYVSADTKLYKEYEAAGQAEDISPLSSRSWIFIIATVTQIVHLVYTFLV
jgi:hypothetical protein